MYSNDELSRDTSSLCDVESPAGAIIGDGDRKSWDARGPMIWDNFSIPPKLAKFPRPGTSDVIRCVSFDCFTLSQCIYYKVITH